MGILTKGPLNVSVLRLQTTLTLQALSEIAPAYQPTDGEPTTGWGSLFDEPGHAQRESLRSRFTSTVPKATKNHRESQVLRMRYYYEVPNTALRRVMDGVSDRNQYCERHGVDMLFLRNSDDSSFMTVLASTTNAADLKTVVKPALDDLVAAGGDGAGAVKGSGTGMATDYAHYDELDPDIFLWLLYRDAHDRKLSPTLKLSEIGRMASKNGPIWVSQFSKGASIDRADILALIAKGNTVFGPAKFSFVHSADPKGYFEITLSENFAFSILRNSEYEDDDLASLPDAEIGPRMTEDAWEVLIPAIREAHRSDRDWHTGKRSAFVNQCKDAVRKI